MHNIHNILHFLTKTLGIKKELKELYLNIVLHILAISLIGIFIPIYLLDIGFDLNAVLYFFLVYWFFFMAGAPLVGKLVSRIGTKYTISMRAPTLILYLFLLVLPQFQKSNTDNASIIQGG